MFTQEISVSVNSNADLNQVIEEFFFLMCSYRANGQTLGRVESNYINGNKIVFMPFTHEEDSLNKRYNNFYVNDRTQKLEKLCNSSIEYRIAGSITVDDEAPCQCKAPRSYTLLTNGFTIASPINCGECNRSVPLYRLPKYNDHGYLQILSWETNYQACDRLQMNCEVGERWALNQMQELTSQLSKQGLKICRQLEELTSLPVYYFLFDYRKYKTDQTHRLCPGCGGKWYLEKALHDFYEFKCDKCKLVSITSPNS